MITNRRDFFIAVADSQAKLQKSLIGCGFIMANKERLPLMRQPLNVYLKPTKGDFSLSLYIKTTELH
jgi:hypothetical protein